MQEYKITVTMIDEPHRVLETRKVPDGTTFLKIAMDIQEKYGNIYPDVIMLALYNGKLRELNKKISGDGTISFVTAKDRDGKRTYRRSVTFLMQKAVSNLWGEQNVRVRVYYSLGSGYYCELKGIDVTADKLKLLEKEMLKLAKEDIPIHKESVKTEKAEAMFKKLGMRGKTASLQEKLKG